jgi:hypothetical protein
MIGALEFTGALIDRIFKGVDTPQSEPISAESFDPVKLSAPQTLKQRRPRTFSMDVPQPMPSPRKRKNFAKAPNAMADRRQRSEYSTYDCESFPA